MKPQLWTTFTTVEMVFTLYLHSIFKVTIELITLYSTTLATIYFETSGL